MLKNVHMVLKKDHDVLKTKNCDVSYQYCVKIVSIMYDFKCNDYFVKKKI
jgi:hypothetical protein